MIIWLFLKGETKSHSRVFENMSTEIDGVLKTKEKATAW